MLFRLPLGVTVYAVSIYVDNDGDFDLIFYDEDEYTILHQQSVSSGQRSITSAGKIIVTLSADVTAIAATWYRVVLVPTTTTNIQLYHSSPTGDGDYNGITALPGGTDYILTSRTGAPSSGDHAWTDTDTSRPAILLHVSGIDIPTDAEVAAAVWAYANRTLTA
jgi:hypothetical protein